MLLSVHVLPVGEQLPLALRFKGDVRRNVAVGNESHRGNAGPAEIVEPHLPGLHDIPVAGGRKSGVVNQIPAVCSLVKVHAVVTG